MQHNLNYIYHAQSENLVVIKGTRGKNIPNTIPKRLQTKPNPATLPPTHPMHKTQEKHNNELPSPLLNF